MSDVPYQQHVDGVLILNGVSPNEDGEYYRAGYDRRGLVIDPTGNSFNPHAGSYEPMEGRCGYVLNKWRIRYGKRRYCTLHPVKDSDTGLCVNHRKRANLVNPKEIIQSGLFTETLKGFYKHIPANRQLYIWIVFDDLCTQSIFDFEREDVTVAVDCSENESLRESLPVDEDGMLDVDVRQPTVNTDRALSLWLAALDRVKMLSGSTQIVADGLGNPETTHAQLNDEGEYVTIEQDTEHHLNLPYSRLSRDIQELLAYGGVGIEDPTEEDTMPSQVVEIYNDPLDTQGSAFSYEDAAQIVPE